MQYNIQDIYKKFGRAVMGFIPNNHRAISIHPKIPHTYPETPYINARLLRLHQQIICHSEIHQTCGGHQVWSSQFNYKVSIYSPKFECGSGNCNTTTTSTKFSIFALPTIANQVLTRGIRGREPNVRAKQWGNGEGRETQKQVNENKKQNKRGKEHTWRERTKKLREREGRESGKEGFRVIVFN